MIDAVSAARFQFAFTIMFHYLFPILTMGLGVLIAVLKTLHLLGKGEIYGTSARFWARIFALTFGMGVVTGIPMEFQFGTNWARLSHYAGPVVGQTLFMEGCSRSSRNRRFSASSCSARSAFHRSSIGSLPSRSAAAPCSFAIISAFPTGSFQGENVSYRQPAKMAAMEGVFRTQAGAPMAIIGMPDTEKGELLDPIVVPELLSFLAYGDRRAVVTGLNDIPKDLHPPVEIVYYAYHIMVGLGTIFIAILAGAALLLWRGQLYGTRGYLWILMLAMPFPYIANEAGWVVAEVGRQPWIVYGLQRTIHATSTNVSAGMTVFSVLDFMGLYALLGLLYLFLVMRVIASGPAGADAHHDEAGAGGAQEAHA